MEQPLPIAINGLGRIGRALLRVAIARVALLDLVATVSRDADPAEIADSYRRAASERFAGMLAVNEEPLVSSDFVGNPHSAIVDLPLMQSLDRRVFRIMAWYDNEWGYANRPPDLLTFISRSSS